MQERGQGIRTRTVACVGARFPVLRNVVYETEVVYETAGAGAGLLSVKGST